MAWVEMKWTYHGKRGLRLYRYLRWRERVIVDGVARVVKRSRYIG